MRKPPREIPFGYARRASRRHYAAVVLVLFAALTLGAGAADAEETRVFYKYTDDAGRLHVVQSLDRVPPQYRSQIGEIALEGKPRWIESAPQSRTVQPRVEYEPVASGPRRGSSGVVLYYADWCGYCRKAKRWLDERDVAYVIRDIDLPRYADELEEVSGGKSVPVLSVGGDLIRGFNPTAYEQALGG